MLIDGVEGFVDERIGEFSEFGEQFVGFVREFRCIVYFTYFGFFHKK